ncbi:Uncharacterised protein [Mycobacteroides abscessus subsp. abscessus]|nr:Uncharacterised protein [Mycobacteroides abscessus subsp. abscessus]
MRYRVDISDAERVGDERTCRRTATGANPDADLFRVGDKVTDDEKVCGETLLLDDVQLVVSTGEVLVGHSPRDSLEAALQSAVHFLTQPGVLIFPLRHREDRHPVLEVPDVFIGLHPFGDQQRVVASTGNGVIPEVPHLGRGFEVIAVAVEFEAGGVRERLPGLHTQQCLVVVRVILGDVVAVVGRQRRDAQLLADLQ